MNQAPLMLSISGLRGLIGKSLTPDVAARYAAAYGTWVKAHGRTPGNSPHVVVGRDSRPSGEMIEQAVLAGLVSTGCKVTAIGIASTPGVAIMVDQLEADGGIVITASHNPIIWNGIKALRFDGVAPPPEQAQEIIDRFKADDVEHAEVEALQPIARDDSLIAVHRDRILAQVDADLIRSAKLKVVLDSVHGAGGPETKALLDELGVELVHRYAEPTGLFPHTPEPTAENLASLSQFIQKHQGGVGFAQDPDADRLAIVDEDGRYIGEEYTLALATLHVFEKAATTGNAQGLAVAANLSTSRMIDDIAATFGAKVIRTPVGEANVAEGMKRANAPIGGEGNGGMILPQVSYVRDSMAGIALVLELLARRQQTLVEIVNDMPRYAIVKDKAPVDEATLARMADVLQDAFADQSIDTQDGVRIDWPDRWVHIRPSNTEPIIRIIAEAAQEDDAQTLIEDVRAKLGLGGRGIEN